MIKQKLLILLLSFLPIWTLYSCSSSNDNSKPTDNTKEKFTQRYNAGQTFYSSILGEEVKYEVLLPQKYLTDTNDNYGVVYLFHGWGDNQSSWGPSGMNIQSIADEAENIGNVRQLIYVMPQGFNSYFCNQYDDKFNYMNMFVNELIPLIDKRFRTTASRTERAVAGYSMGGFGALTLASQHPDLFSVSIGLSPSLNTDEQYTTLSQDGWNLQWGSVFGGYGTSGYSRLTSYYKSQCPLHLFEDKAASTFQDVHYYIDCGDDEERLYIGNGALHSLMRDKNINHEYRVRNGAHTTSYWVIGMKEALSFVEQSFQGKSYPQESGKSFSESIHSTEKNIKTGNSAIELWLPNDYNADLSYSVLYFSKGSGNSNLSTKDIAVALDSLMREKKIVIAGFDVNEVMKNGTTFSEIVNTVENEVHTEKTAASRIGLIYGSNGNYLYNNSLGNALLGSLFLEDANVTTYKSDNKANLYYLDIADNGTNYKSMLSLFNYMREQEANIQYRVRNGVDDLFSAQNGIYSMSYFIGNYLAKK
jgi:enterochelin esterase-like enzyme